MATTKYIYPRVNISTNTVNRSSAAPDAEDTTSLFVPMLTEKGPSEVVTRVRTLSEFSDIFGRLDKAEDYERNGQMALNLSNWLTNGGTAYIFRLNGLHTMDADGKPTDTAVFENETKAKIEIGSFVKNDETVDNFTADENAESGEGEITTTIYKLKTVEGKLLLDSDSGAVSAMTDINLKYAEVTTKGDLKISCTVYEYKSTFSSNAKYYGSYYNSVSVVVSKRSETAFDLKVIYTNPTSGIKTTVEEYQRLTNNSYKKALLVSEYIDAESFDITKIELDNKPVTLKYMGGVDGAVNDLAIVSNNVTLLEYFWKNVASYYLENRLAFPIDTIIDAGYPENVKKAMMEFICNSEAKEDSAKRTDIVGLFDLFVLGDYTSGISKAPSDDLADISKYDDYKCTNIAIYQQYFKINDSILTDSDIFVTPTYFLSKLIPYNDIQEGIQLPTAGVRRGVLDDAIFVNENPLPNTKNDWFKARVNYVEKTPREYAFMSQRTFDGSTEDKYTALSFLNNERCLERMKKDIERLSRDYLFEFNDSVTLAQLSNVLNRYITDWISKRALSKGVITVTKNPYSDEAVDVNLTIKFTGTIEVISVDITIE